MTTGKIICASGESLCYHAPAAAVRRTLQCDYRVDHWGRTCDAWMCREHATAVSFGRDHCTGHEPAKNQGRMAL